MHLFRHPECVEQSKKYLRLLPKRRNGPHPNQEPVCWGLQPIRQISIPAIVGLFVAIVVLSGVLGGLWLLKHPKDLGGAMAVPAVVVAYLGFGVALLQAYSSCLAEDESLA
jgi:hypothetical protein